MTQPQAKEFCEANGLGLVKISNEMDQTRIADYLNTIADKENEMAFWIGLSDQVLENHFVWEDGSPLLSYSNWATGQPDDWENGEDCVQVWTSARKWIDVKCNSYRYALCM